MTYALRTVRGGTLTSEGVIPHKRHNGVDCPVKLRFWTNATPVAILKEPMEPLRFAGRLVYALPNGGELLGD